MPFSGFDATEMAHLLSHISCKEIYFAHVTNSYSRSGWDHDIQPGNSGFPNTAEIQFSFGNSGTESQQWWYTLWTADLSFSQWCVNILSKDNISAFLLYSVVRAGERQERWHSQKALAMGCTMGCSSPPELPWSPLCTVAQCVCPTLLGLLEQCWALITSVDPLCKDVGGDQTNVSKADL